MLAFGITLYLFLSSVSADAINSFHTGKSTEKPDILYEENPVHKHRKPPTHISEFTDPDTGLNPFLDLEEGPTSAERNVMKDERRADPPFFDDIVEGEAAERHWGFEIPKEPPLEEPFPRRPPLENDLKEEKQPTTIQHNSKAYITTTASYYKTSIEEMPNNEKQNDGQKIKKEITTSSLSKNVIVYVAATMSTVIVLALFVGVCWWRRKLKRTSQSSATAENGEVKS